jgi:hypothetical protein
MQRSIDNSPSVSCLLSLVPEIKGVIIEEVDDSTTISEIIWRFSRYPEESGCRLPARKNPHFYLQLPTFAASYDSKFRKVPLKDFGHLHLGQSDTIYVLQDKSCRLFLNAATPHIPRIFSNLWRTHQKVILKGEYVNTRTCVLYYNPCAFKMLSAIWNQKTSSFATLGRAKTSGIAPLESRIRRNRAAHVSLTFINPSETAVLSWNWL